MTDDKYRKSIEKKPLPWLLKKAQEYCNQYIRLRDKDLPCASCGKFKELEAGHIFHASECSGLRFEETNILGECKHCNYYRSDHVINLLATAEKRFGKESVENLKLKRDWFKRHGHKWDRFTVIEVILMYKRRIKDE